MAGHASVIAAALNQADLLTPEQAGECVADLRRLLDAEGLHGARVLVTSATTGEGVAELRRVLIETVVARQAAVQRIGADVDALAARFARYAADDGVRRRLSAAVPRPRAGLRGPSASDGPEGAAAGVRSGGGPGHAGGGKGLANAEPEPPANAEPEPPADAQPEASANAGPEPPAEAEQEASANAAPEPPAEAEQEAAARLTYATGALAETFAVAAGVSGVCSALRSARELKAVDYVGWPMAWLADRVARRDPARKVRLGALWDELRGASAGSAGAQQAEINSAITAFADEAGRGLPGLWHASVRHAARSNVHDIPAALGVAIGEALPQENKVAPWWRAVAAWQGLLLGAVAVGLGWLVAILVRGVFGAAPHAALLLRDAGLLPWVAPMVAAVLLLGWLTANGSMALVIREAEGDRLHAEFQMRAGIADVARRLVVAPVEQELSEFARFHAELAVARGAG
jgi:hypothetical protein